MLLMQLSKSNDIFYHKIHFVFDSKIFFIKFRAIKIGSKKPLLINAVKDSFKLADQVALLGALEASYNVIIIFHNLRWPF